MTTEKAGGLARADPELARLRVFVILWAVAHVVHMLLRGGPSLTPGVATSPTTWLLVIAALVVLWQPLTAWRLALLAGAQLLHLALNLPWVPNHWVIAGIVNAGLLAALAHHWRGARGPQGGAAAVARLLPFARLGLLLAYGAAAIAKLNAGFFDAEHSCAITLFFDATAMLGGLAPTTAPASLPWVVAGIEFLVFGLLVVPRTRTAGVVVGVVFHTAISVTPGADGSIFTFFLFALLFLYLPAGAGNQVVDEFAALRGRYPWLVPLGGRTARFAISLALMAVLLGRSGLLGVMPYLAVLWSLVVLGLVSIGGGLLLLAWRLRGQASQAGRPVAVHGPAQVLLVALVVLNAAAPYLGGKTTTSFTMFSNLRTEGGVSNHFVLPRLPIESSQDDLVAVIDSSNEVLQGYADDEVLLSWHRLRGVLAADPDASIRYRRGGEVVDLDRAAQDPELVTTHPILHRVVGHRLVDTGPPLCRW